MLAAPWGPVPPNLGSAWLPYDALNSGLTLRNTLRAFRWFLGTWIGVLDEPAAPWAARAGEEVLSGPALLRNRDAVAVLSVRVYLRLLKTTDLNFLGCVF